MNEELETAPVPIVFSDVLDLENEYRAQYIRFIYLLEKGLPSNYVLMEKDKEDWEEHVNFMNNSGLTALEVIINPDQPDRPFGYLTCDEYNSIEINISPEEADKGYFVTALDMYISAYPDEDFDVYIPKIR
jgi:hypothetical protein